MLNSARLVLAGLYLGRLSSGRAIAAQLAADLRRFRPRTAPETGKRALIHRILQLNRGRPLGETAIGGVLAGKNRQRLAAVSAILPL